DYLYIPLGGSRGGRFSACRNLMITMTISGLWHGASWNMVLWGAYHGALLALAHLIFGKGGQPILPRPIAIVKTYLVVMLGFIFFRAASLPGAIAVLQHMTWPAAGLSLPATSVGVAV